LCSKHRLPWHRRELGDVDRHGVVGLATGNTADREELHHARAALVQRAAGNCEDKIRLGHACHLAPKVETQNNTLEQL
jgi:hypothetical protein